jgi:hypothetical protein
MRNLKKLLASAKCEYRRVGEVSLDLALTITACHDWDHPMFRLSREFKRHLLDVAEAAQNAQDAATLPPAVLHIRKESWREHARKKLAEKTAAC